MEKNLKKDINEALMVLGVQPHLKGFNYLGYALYEILDGKISDYKITGHGGLYEHIAKEFDATQSNVEGHAVKVPTECTFWDRGATARQGEVRANSDDGADRAIGTKGAVVNILKYEPERLRR